MGSGVHSITSPGQRAPGADLLDRCATIRLFPFRAESQAGDKVTIELVSRDIVHGLYLDSYGVSVEADPGQTATLSFIADKSGPFRFRCNVTCGAMPPFMICKLTVGTKDWLYRSDRLPSHSWVSS